VVDCVNVGGIPLESLAGTAGAGRGCRIAVKTAGKGQLGCPKKTLRHPDFPYVTALPAPLAGRLRKPELSRKIGTFSRLPYRQVACIDDNV